MTLVIAFIIYLLIGMLFGAAALAFLKKQNVCKPSEIFENKFGRTLFISSVLLWPTAVFALAGFMVVYFKTCIEMNVNPLTGRTAVV